MDDGLSYWKDGLVGESMAPKMAGLEEGGRSGVGMRQNVRDGGLTFFIP